MILTAIDNGDDSVGIPGCEITLDLEDWALDKDDRDQIKEGFVAFLKSFDLIQNACYAYWDCEEPSDE